MKMLMNIKMIPSVLFILLFIAIYYIQTESDQISGKMSKANALSLLPKGELIKRVSLGYSSVMADLLWLEVVQAIGEKEPAESGYQWIYHATDVVTTLDPKFEYAYQIAGIALSALGKQYELSNQILLKGIRNRPDDWRIPYYLGFNYFFYLKDYQNAADYMSRAAKLPGRPSFLPGLAARLYIEARDPGLALDFLQNMLQNGVEENVKKQIELRIREVTIERDILVLNRAIDEYQRKFERAANDISDLVSSNKIDRVPEEPFGGYYFYDHSKKTAQSSTHPERMKAYRKH